MSVALEKAANAVSGKTARACDSCLRRRARWYCAADDAFLCQPCDFSVHSANPLARRHDRVRLKTSSSLSIADRPAPAHTDLSNDSTLPAWHRGLKRKARTPRHGKNSMMLRPLAALVPDLDAALADEDGEQEKEEEEQLLYQVPVFDPALAEFCSPPSFDETNSQQEEKAPLMSRSDGLVAAAGFGPSDAELAEFAADVENLLGQGLDDDDNFCIDGLGLLDANLYDDRQNQVIKMELTTDTMINGASNGNFLVDMESESLEFNFDCGSAGEEAEEQKVEVVRKGIGLRLDCEAVIAAWSCRSCSPWTDGERPQFNLDDCWPDSCRGIWGTTGGGEVQGAYGDVGIGGQLGVHGNGGSGREARVSRYREKRRTRLFSKKIRYEVRKLNAEKRPRMKGRFVKRGSNPAAADGSATFPYV